MFGAITAMVLCYKYALTGEGITEQQGCIIVMGAMVEGVLEWSGVMLAGHLWRRRRA